MKTAHDIFISHSTRINLRHRKFVDELATTLESHGHNVFLDRLHLKSGVIMPSLRNAIQNSTIGILVLTKKSLKSIWVARECEEMVKCWSLGRMRLVVLRLDSDCLIPEGLPNENVIDTDHSNDILEIVECITKHRRSDL
jgi:hypothetical protein